MRETKLSGDQASQPLTEWRARALNSETLNTAPISAPTSRATSAPKPQGKKPRRTAERILEVTLDLFNRFGEPNVSTKLISAEMGISPGNLYCHYPAKDELINTLFATFELRLDDLLQAADQVRNVEDAWLFFHMLLELIWEYRFLYRDLNDLLSKKRRLETHFQFVLKSKSRAVQQVFEGLTRGNSMRIDRRDTEPVASSMVVVLTYWLSFEYVRDPRRALEPESPRARERG